MIYQCFFNSLNAVTQLPLKNQKVEAKRLDAVTTKLRGEQKLKKSGTTLWKLVASFLFLFSFCGQFVFVDKYIHKYLWSKVTVFGSNDPSASPWSKHCHLHWSFNFWQAYAGGQNLAKEHCVISTWGRCVWPKWSMQPLGIGMFYAGVF